MIEKKIRVLKDHRLKTIYGIHYLSEGEVKRVRFKNRNTFKELIGSGCFVEADSDEEETKLIPIIPPIEISEDPVDDEVEVVPVSEVEPSSMEIKLPEANMNPNDFVEAEGNVLGREEFDVEEVTIEQQDPDKPELEPGEELEDVGSEDILEDAGSED